MLFFRILYIYGLLGSAALALAAEVRVGVDKNAPPKSAIYSPFGKRDPFRIPAWEQNAKEVASLQPLEKYSLEQFQLKAILRGLGKPKAMFEDPDGKTHILTEGDVIGRERASVSRIVDSEVIMTQRTFNYLGAESLLEKVISLPADGADALGAANPPPAAAVPAVGRTAGVAVPTPAPTPAPAVSK